MSKERSVIVHYHLFKNAGTSVDRLLQKNFGERWLGFDGNSAGNIITTAELEKKINENPDVDAFSSHQIVPPVPQIDGHVFPIVFLRDPIDRIKSAYLFEWQKQLGLEKPKGSLKEYVYAKFKNRRSSAIEEFQSIRLSNEQRERFSKGADDEQILWQACKFIENLSFVGIVDRFDASAELLQRYLKPEFAGFKSSNIQANTLQDTTVSLDQKKTAIKEELGDELYEMIVNRNYIDHELYQFGLRHFENLQSTKLVSNG